MKVVQVEPLEQSAVRRPHPALRPYVTRYSGWSVQGGRGGVHHGLPSRSLTVILSFDEPLTLGWCADGHDRVSLHTSASGLHTDPAYIVRSARESGVQLSLTPAGARALLGLPAAALASCTADLADLLGPRARQLQEKVAAQVGWTARLAALDDALLQLLRIDRPAMRPELAFAWAAFGGGEISSQRVAEQVGWSRSHLASAVRAEFGVRPKEVVRVRRFEQALAAMSAECVPSLAELAADCGYADQAHFTREWRALSGRTPTEWRREELSIVQDVEC